MRFSWGSADRNSPLQDGCWSFSLSYCPGVSVSLSSLLCVSMFNQRFKTLMKIATTG